MEKRKEKYGFEKGVDLIVTPDESVKVGDEVVPMKEILDRIRLKSGELLEKDLTEPPAGKTAEKKRKEMTTELDTAKERYQQLDRMIKDPKQTQNKETKETYVKEREELGKIVSVYENYKKTTEKLEEKKKLLASLTESEKAPSAPESFAEKISPDKPVPFEPKPVKKSEDRPVRVPAEASVEKKTAAAGKTLSKEISKKESEPKAAEPATPASTVVMPAPSVATTTPSVGTPAPSVATTTPSSGTPAPSVGTKAPSVGTPAPSVATTTPSSGTPAPSVATTTPSVGTPAPSVGTTTPSVGTPAPSVGTKATPSVTTAPTVGAPTPSIKAPAPSVAPVSAKASKPSIRAGKRRVNIEALKKEIREEINTLMLKKGDLESELIMLLKKEKRPEAYGIYVVRSKDNIWNIHYKFLKEYFGHRHIDLTGNADEPDTRGRSSGVGKILKFSEKMVYIYNIRERELTSNIDIIHPLSKIVVFNMSKVFELLKDVAYQDMDQIQFDGENIWLPAKS